jgi:pimeloyl-ACP methyl ester carboxylesterase
MRALAPERADHIERDGARIGYEVFGKGDPSILLLPTWTLIHSRFWKMQVPYLARHYRVITYDGPGNGRSDRPLDPARYSGEAYAEDATLVLDACGVENAVVVGLSRGAHYGLRLATLFPDRVLGLVVIGPSLPLGPPAPGREMIEDGFWEKYPDDPVGWDKYNVAYWHDHYLDFLEFFFDQGFVEPHSTKPIEDAIGWALEGGPEILEAEARRPELGPGPEEMLAGLRCPLLVIHGTKDRIQPHHIGVEAARLGNGALISLEGAGHFPNVRDPVQVNLLLRRFVEGLGS